MSKKKDGLEELSDSLSFFLQYTDDIGMPPNLTEPERNAWKKAYLSGKIFWENLDNLIKVLEEKHNPWCIS